ncbi:MAG: RodZ domain-containing protein [Desulfatiglandales bacterium]
MKRVKVDNSHNDKKADDIPEDISLGDLLRRSREERQIDLDEAVRVTRIRRHTLEAIENEEWSKLPSDVFIKGFIRSYAGFLGLDKEMVLNRYRKNSPSQEYKPQALEEISMQSRRLHLIIIIVIASSALALIAAGIYIKGRDTSVIGNAIQYLKTPNPAEKEEGHRVQEEEEKEALFLVGETQVEKAGETASEPKSIEDTIVPEGPNTTEETKEVVEKKEETALKSESIEDITIIEGPTVAEETKDERSLSPRFILTANVNSQTWIAIYIDDEPVKEYLLESGNKMKWEADKGFDILVGNAGGIEFFLNGEEVGHLGPEGKVVRLKLPEGI